ncbi:hypothetical protein JVT61DRAFT_12177 [Boletus reticuloceps]|uniref:Uncharacterized protein n=1 Tax=Boletus reticuloceps TaxID=495285 RepID=A0A8I2YEN8_9AGAM|nr:hypothetical protein JVT61DRAFT_12177 [Boletus reticuloceps]
MQCAQEFEDLGLGKHDWQFNALHAWVEQIENFRIDQIALEMERETPRLWDLLDALMARVQEGRSSDTVIPEDAGDMDEEDEELEYWNGVDDIEEIIEGIEDTHVSRAACLASRKKSVIKLVCCLM